ncbi:MAG: hypothetical protein JWP27_1129, partial [Flaviaesturariibacter sp.]|nr:hypothetical protein [Flaviaesturariibacter sp.]
MISFLKRLFSFIYSVYAFLVFIALMIPV